MTTTPLPTAVDHAVAVNQEFLNAATPEINDAFRKRFLKEVEWMRDYAVDNRSVTIEFADTSDMTLEPRSYLYFPEEFYRELRALGYRVTFKRVETVFSSFAVATITFE